MVLIWCPRLDLNQHRIAPTTTSRLTVVNFDVIINSIHYSLPQLWQNGYVYYDTSYRKINPKTLEFY